VAVELQQDGIGVGHANGPVSVESAAAGLGRRDAARLGSFRSVPKRALRHQASDRSVRELFPEAFSDRWAAGAI
jgi:hypothetical protein